MLHEGIPLYGQGELLFTTTDAPWLPLDEVMTLWATFSREASSVDTARATSEAFTAVAKEREALHSFTLNQQLHARTPEQAVDLYQIGIDALTLAATHWFEAAYALAKEATECSTQNDTVMQHTLRMLIGHALSQRLRVWTIVQHILREQVRDYLPYLGVGVTVSSPEASCPTKEEEVAR
jgi:hypothetical protein